LRWYQRWKLVSPPKEKGEEEEEMEEKVTQRSYPVARMV